MSRLNRKYIDAVSNTMRAYLELKDFEMMNPDYLDDRNKTGQHVDLLINACMCSCELKRISRELGVADKAA